MCSMIKSLRHCERFSGIKYTENPETEDPDILTQDLRYYFPRNLSLNFKVDILQPTDNKIKINLFYKNTKIKRKHQI